MTAYLTVLPFDSDTITPEAAIEWLKGEHGTYSAIKSRLFCSDVREKRAAASWLDAEIDYMVDACARAIEGGGDVRVERDCELRGESKVATDEFAMVNSVLGLLIEGAEYYDTDMPKWGAMHDGFVDLLNARKEVIGEEAVTVKRVVGPEKAKEMAAPPLNHSGRITETEDVVECAIVHCGAIGNASRAVDWLLDTCVPWLRTIAVLAKEADVYEALLIAHIANDLHCTVRAVAKGLETGTIPRVETADREWRMLAETALELIPSEHEAVEVQAAKQLLRAASNGLSVAYDDLEHAKQAQHEGAVDA